jgi:hypothetical protein
VIMDNFEKKLQSQKLRSMPGEWRESILRTAQERAMATAALRKPLLNHFLLAGWRELIRPYRFAWATIAALWLVFGIVNSHTDLAPGSIRMASTGARPQAIGLIEEKRRVLVELTGPMDLSTARTSLRPSPKPHTERTLTTRNC